MYVSARDGLPARQVGIWSAEKLTVVGRYMGVAVSVMDNVLTVKGERKADHDPTGKDYFVREVAYGAFERSFTLPEGVDAAHMEAKYANGILEVRVPAPRAATPRMIEVKAA